MRVFRVAGKASLRVGAMILSLGIFALAGRVLLGGTEVRAAMDTYYPQFCLGGWEHPRHASGEPDADSGSFSSDTAAVLAPDVSAQIFCGYFPVEAHTNAPVSATIRLIWDMPGARSTSAPSAAPTEASASQEAPTDQSTTADVPEAPAELATTTEETAPASVGPEAYDTSPETPSDGASSAPPATSVTPADPAPTTPAPDTTPPEQLPTTAPAPAANDTPTSLMYSASRVAGAWIRTHTAIAHAQEDGTSSAPFSISDWFEVSYSLDGVRWHSIGRVNASNWRDFSVNVPLSSWEDLENVQIMVAALPSLSERPPVYLDAMELRVETDPTLSETASAAIGAANDMVGSAVDAVLSLFGNEKTPEQQQAAVLPMAAQTPAPAPAERTKKRVLQFTVSGNTIPVSSRLPWQDKETQDDLASTTRTNSPEVSRSDDGRSFIVSGSCSKEFATVITYRNASDYRDNPRNALANVATPCEGGHYTFNLGGLPDSTLGGTYYLLIGEQSATSTWTPSSALLPITIQPVEVEE